MRDSMTPEVRQAVIMVGGKGVRLRPLTETKPKPLLPVLDKPCLRYLIESLADAGIKHVIMACGYKSDMLTSEIGDGSDMGIEIEYSYEDEPMGTGGAIKLVEDRLDDVFVAANGDIFADIDVKDEINRHFQTGAKISLALTPVKNPCEFGIVRLDDTGRILEFKEKPKPEEVFSDLVNAGIYIMNKDTLSHVPSGTFFDLSRDLFPIVMDRGDRMQGYVLSGVWRDVGRPSDLLGANLIMASKKYDDYGWGGRGTENATLRKPFYMGKDSSVNGSAIMASVVLSNCKVTGSKVTNSLIMKGCEVDGARIENSILGDRCKVMHGAVVTNSVLGDGTVVKANEILVDQKSG